MTLPHLTISIQACILLLILITLYTYYYDIILQVLHYKLHFLSCSWNSGEQISGLSSLLPSLR